MVFNHARTCTNWEIENVCQLSCVMANTELTQRLFRLTVTTAITHGNMAVSNNNNNNNRLTDKEAKIFIFR